jgi:CRP/FNR family transcriptional regulator, cyclic AMP receptor protein
MNTVRVPYGLELGIGFKPCKLGGISSFCVLPSTAAKDFDAIKSTANYPTGAVLFAEKEDSRGVFVLCQGEVKLSISSTGGRTLVIRAANAGEILGLASAVAGTPYDITAETVCRSQVAFVRREDFLRFLTKWPQAIQIVARQMSEQYQSVLMAKTVA